MPVALALDGLVKRGQKYRLGACVALLLLVVASGWTVFAAPNEGLSAVRNNLVKYQGEAVNVFELTENDALIVVDRADKYLYPERSVLYPLRSDHTYELLPAAVSKKPTYYFGLTLPAQDFDWLREKKLPPLGLTVVMVADWGEKSLYRFEANE